MAKVNPKLYDLPGQLIGGRRMNEMRWKQKQQQQPPAESEVDIIAPIYGALHGRRNKKWICPDVPAASSS